jgi:hypothetical protein
MELKLFKLLGKDVKVVDMNDEEWIGHVELFTPRIDNDDNKADIGLTCENEEYIIVFTEDMIKSVEEIN